MEQSKKTDLIDIFLFYTPLLLTTGIMSLSTPLINYGMGKAHNPELALASFAASFSVMIVVNSLTFSCIPVFLSHIKDKQSFNTTLKFFAIITLISSVVLLTLAYSDFGMLFFTNILQLNHEVARESRSFLLFVTPVPFFSLLRFAFSSIATVYKKTHLLAIATTIRLITASVLVIILISIFPETPGKVAALSFGLAIFMEFIYIYHATKKYHDFKKPNSVKDYKNKLTISYLIKFTLPIWAAGLAWTISFPIINYILGYTQNNTSSLAGFGVLRSLIILFGAPLYSIKTAIQVLGNTTQDRKNIRFFSIIISSIATTIIFFLTIFFKKYILHNIFNLSGLTLNYAISAFPLLVLIPILSLLRTYPQGVFLRIRKTKSIGVAGIFRLFSIIIFGFVTLKLFPEINGVFLGAYLMVIASLSDATILISSLYIKSTPIKNEYAC